MSKKLPLWKNKVKAAGTDPGNMTDMDVPPGVGQIDRREGFDPSMMPHEGRPMDDVLPGAGVFPAKVDLKQAVLIKPYYLGKEIKLNNPYPTVAKIMAAEGDDAPPAPEMGPAPEGAEPPAGEPPVEGPAPEEGDREAVKQANFEKLGIESPEEFGIKNKGKLEELAEEHGIGDLLGYSFRSEKIEVVGTDKILLLDYDLNPLHTRDLIMMGAEAEEAPAGEPEEEEEEPKKEEKEE
jgi:hypothetical protein